MSITTSPVRKKPNESPATMVRDENYGTITPITSEPTPEIVAKKIDGTNASHIDIDHDAENARRFVANYADKVRYCPERGEWLTFDGQRWRVDRDNVTVGELAKESNLEQSRELLDQASNNQDTTTRKQLKRRANRLGMRGAIEAAVQLARTDPKIIVTLKQLDAEEYALNCFNGILNLRTGKLEPHDPARLMTKMANVKFEPNAKAPRWEIFLTEILPNPEIQEYLQQFLGSSLSAAIIDQQLHEFVGTGANGKSVLVEIFREILGDYAAIIESELLVETRNEGHPTSKMQLIGARFATCNEIEGNARLSEVKVKRLTGGDKLQARGMHKDFVEFAPTFKPVLIANYRPTIQDTDEAIRRRLIVVPFDVTIEPLKRDPHLKAKLMTELPGILAWALEGCLAWQRAGKLEQPKDIEMATLTMFNENDTVTAFIDECCTREIDAREPRGMFYDSYVNWCKKAALPMKSANVVARQMKRTFQMARTTQRLWVGLTINPEHRVGEQLTLDTKMTSTKTRTT